MIRSAEEENPYPSGVRRHSPARSREDSESWVFFFEYWIAFTIDDVCVMVVDDKGVFGTKLEGANADEELMTKASKAALEPTADERNMETSTILLRVAWVSRSCEGQMLEIGIVAKIWTNINDNDVMAVG